MDHVTLGISRESDVAPKFGLTGTSYFFGFKDQDKILDAEAVARAGFDAVLSETFKHASDRDKVGVSISHPTLDTEVLVAFGDKDETTTDKIMEMIGMVQQSKKELNFDDTMTVKVTRITPPQGEGYRPLKKGRLADLFPNTLTGTVPCSSRSRTRIAYVSPGQWL